MLHYGNVEIFCFGSILNMATLKAIAEKTGLSINTVSRAIRGEGYVSKRAAELVANAVRELDYRPNQAARELRLKSSREIIVAAESYDYLNIKRIAGACDYASQHDYKTSVRFFSGKDRKQTDDVFADISRQRPAGVVFVTSTAEVIEKIASLRSEFPCTAATMSPVDNCDCVCVDRFSGVYNAIQYLYRKGRRKIVFGETCGAANRKEGYLRAVRDLGLPEIIIQATSANHEEIRQSGIAAARTIAEMKDVPDAIQTSDYLACGLLSEFSRLGIRVPEDIAVIGFDDREIAEMTDPPLTTIAHPGEEVGEACSKMIIDRIQSGFCSDALPQCVKIPMKLVIRRSA